GPRVLDFVRRLCPPLRQKGNRLLGTVLRIDKFGNIITNLRLKDLGREFSITVAGVPITKLCGSFSEAEPSEFFAIQGSTGFIELALNQGSAAERLHVERGAEIEVETESLNQ